jgi:PIN domain nuclease of toxin-antitoxin system
MKFLFDTHILLWAVEGSAKLPADVYKILADPAAELIFSVASIWEIAIKHAKGLPSFQARPEIVRSSLLTHGYSELVIQGGHAVAAGSLPRIHKDPFDRVLVAQAMIEGITLLTADLVIAQYPGPIRRV